MRARNPALRHPVQSKIRAATRRRRPRPGVSRTRRAARAQAAHSPPSAAGREVRATPPRNPRDAAVVRHIPAWRSTAAPSRGWAAGGTTPDLRFCATDSPRDVALCYV
eukprot:6261969-Prymnesium_polylepis.1